MRYRGEVTDSTLRHAVTCTIGSAEASTDQLVQHTYAQQVLSMPQYIYLILSCRPGERAGMPRRTQTAAGRWSLTWHRGPEARPRECRA